MLTTTLLLLALSAGPAPTDTIRLGDVQSMLRYHRPGIVLILAQGDTTATLAVSVREPQFFETTALTLTDFDRRDSMPMAILQSDSSTVDARTDSHTHTLWYHVDLRHLRFWAAAGAPGVRAGKVRGTLDPEAQRRLRAAVARMNTKAR